MISHPKILIPRWWFFFGWLMTKILGPGLNSICSFIQDVYMCVQVFRTNEPLLHNLCVYNCIILYCFIYINGIWQDRVYTCRQKVLDEINIACDFFRLITGREIPRRRVTGSKFELLVIATILAETGVLSVLGSLTLVFSQRCPKKILLALVAANSS